MKAHELHPILNDITFQLKKDYPVLDFTAEAVDNAVSLLVIFPNGGKSKFHADISDIDEVIPQPAFYAVADNSNTNNEMINKELNDKWINMLQGSLTTKGFEYFYDEVGGEG